MIVTFIVSQYSEGLISFFFDYILHQSSFVALTTNFTTVSELKWVLLVVGKSSVISAHNTSWKHKWKNGLPLINLRIKEIQEEEMAKINHLVLLCSTHNSSI